MTATKPGPRIGVTGAAGRMGRMLVAGILASPDCHLAGAAESPGHADIGQDPGLLAGAGETGQTIVDDTPVLFAESDVVIDFTSPAATAGHATLAAQGRVGLVIGTTGLGPGEQAAIDAAARHTAIVQAPNMSLGINLLLALVEKAAAVLEDSFDIEIVEMHHRHKIDAPSGTALALGRAAAAGRGVAHDDVAVLSREGVTGERPTGAIGYAALRGGDVIGEHSVIFAGGGERIELSHRAGSRQLFAAGALRAALWAHGRGPGLATMRDVLGLD